MQFQPKFKNINEINNIIDSYQSGVNMKTLAKNFNCCQQTIKQLLVKNNIELKSNPGNKKYTINENYFENIDSHDKSQILGMLAADGNIYNRSIRLALIEDDKEYLNHIANKLNFTGILYTYPVKKSRNKMCYLQFVSQKIANDLEKIGIIPNKSLVLKFPTFEQIPKDYINSFVLGYFEGDGCININKAKSSIISICGTFEFCHSLSLILAEILKLNPSVYKHGRKESNTYCISFGGNLKVLTFLKWIYKDCTFRMTRKYKKYLELKTKYNELNQHGITHAAKIGENSSSQFTVQDIFNIRELSENGTRNIDIAKIYNTSAGTICNIITRKRWKNLTKESMLLYQKFNIDLGGK